MKKFRNLLFSAVLFSGLSHACTKPEAPVLPDDASVPDSQMDEAKNEVAAYVTAAQAYIECAAREKSAGQISKSTTKQTDDPEIPRRS